jgi:hypothetical protein
LQDFDSRVLWISVWSQSSVGHNDFLGEINIPLANCGLDILGEYKLLPRAQPENVIYFFKNLIPSSTSFFFC